MDPDFEKVLKYILQIDKFTQLFNGNSIVRTCDKPKIFQRVYPRLKNEIVYKQTKIRGSEEEKKQILKQIDREIELMELFNHDQNVAVCFSYFRVFDFAFLLFPRYIGTLTQGFKNWPKNQEAIFDNKKDVYVIALRAATSLRCLHEINIIHRDLKPENIFIDTEISSQCQVFIADFDCSKKMKGDVNLSMTNEDCSYTLKYDPPEQEQTLKYDIFQFGLIMLTIANYGKYIGDEVLGPRLIPDYHFNNLYSKQAIIKQLSSKGYDMEFMDLIAQCLQKNPNQRPQIQQIEKQLQRLNSMRFPTFKPFTLPTEQVKNFKNESPLINQHHSDSNIGLNPCVKQFGSSQYNPFNQNQIHSENNIQDKKFIFQYLGNQTEMISMIEQEQSYQCIKQINFSYQSKSMQAFSSNFCFSFLNCFLVFSLIMLHFMFYAQYQKILHYHHLFNRS